jgi:hypothetical protein
LGSKSSALESPDGRSREKTVVSRRRHPEITTKHRFTMQYYSQKERITKISLNQNTGMSCSGRSSVRRRRIESTRIQCTRPLATLDQRTFSSIVCVAYGLHVETTLDRIQLDSIFAKNPNNSSAGMYCAYAAVHISPMTSAFIINSAP